MISNRHLPTSQYIQQVYQPVTARGTNSDYTQATLASVNVIQSPFILKSKLTLSLRFNSQVIEMTQPGQPGVNDGTSTYEERPNNFKILAIYHIIYNFLLLHGNTYHLLRCDWCNIQFAGKQLYDNSIILLYHFLLVHPPPPPADDKLLSRAGDQG